MRKLALWLLIGCLLCQVGFAASLHVETGSMLPLKVGNTGSLVMRVQARLIELGFAYGLPDGIYGKRTEQAVKMAQRALAKLKLPSPSVEVTGQVDERLYRWLTGEAFPAPDTSIARNKSGDDVTRLQRRLILLGYMNKVTGTYADLTRDAVKAFQARNGIEVDGVAGAETLARVYSRTAVAAEKPAHSMMVYVDTAGQRVYAYEWDGTGYNRLVREMLCSTGKAGSATITGIYQTQEHCGDWYYFGAFQVWAKYAIRIYGPYLFHSTLFTSRNESAVQTASVRALGTRASHGCIRMSVEDMLWMYDNTETGFTTILY